MIPAFATRAVSDRTRSRTGFVDGLDFIVRAAIPAPAGAAALGHLRRWRDQDLLLVPAGSVPPPAAPGFRLTVGAEATDLV